MSIGKLDDPYEVSLSRAIELIEAKRDKDDKAVIRVFDEDPDLKVLNGRWGAYISYKKGNFKIPKKVDAQKLTFEECMKIISESPEPKSKRARKK